MAYRSRQDRKAKKHREFKGKHKSKWGGGSEKKAKSLEASLEDIIEIIHILRGLPKKMVCRRPKPPLMLNGCAGRDKASPREVSKIELQRYVGDSFSLGQRDQSHSYM